MKTNAILTKKVIYLLSILSVILIMNLFTSNTSYAGARTTTIKFSKGKIIEVAYASIKKGKEKQLFGEYFPKAIPIAAKYGAKPLGVMLNIINIPRQGGLKPLVKPNIIGFFEWSSVDDFLALHDDPDFQAIVPIREDALTYLNPGNFYAVDEDVVITFREDKMYEVFSAWIKPGADSELKKYKSKTTSVASALGQKNLLKLKPVHLSTKVHRLVASACNKDQSITTPSITGINEWPSVQAFNSFINSSEYNKAKSIKRNALRRLEIFHTKFAFPPPENK